MITLTTAEVVLGVDNIVYLHPRREAPAQQARARRTGLLAAMLTRLLLLMSLAWLARLTSRPPCPGTDGCASRGLL